MSSINLHPTFHYSQPEEYHFSHDSVFLARWLAENPQVREKFKDGQRVLDLCAGTGVIGLDLAYHLIKDFWTQELTLNLEFVDVQPTCQTHFEINQKTLKSSFQTIDWAPHSFSFTLANYQELYLTGKYKDNFTMILCNPPYFNKSHGKLSPSEFKNRSRFFIDSNMKYLIQFICQALKPGGSAYVLLKNLNNHGQDTLAEAQSHLKPDCQLLPTLKIRGTDVVEIKKSPLKEKF